MQNNNEPDSINEIDIIEILYTLSAFKLTILFVSIIGIVIGGHKAFTTKNTYVASAKYTIFSKTANLSLGGELGSIKSLSTLTGMGDKLKAPLDLVLGRKFIEKLNAKVNLREDKYYNPKTRPEALWRVRIKNIIGWQNILIDSEEAIWQRIISKYRSSTNLSVTDGGSIKINVTHENAARSAYIANVIMENIIEHSQERADSDQEKQIRYLGKTLSNSLNELENANTRLQNFTIENGVIPLEDFAIGAQQLNNFRDRFAEAMDLQNALSKLTSLLKTGSTSDIDYQSLRQRHPIVDEVIFRRILGQNENITVWSWPKLKSVEAVLETLTDRTARLEAQVAKMQREATDLKVSGEKYASLLREKDIAEASYTVLIEQVKAQTTFAGFRPDTAEIFEYASAPLIPSAPRKMFLILCGGLLGLLAGCSIAIILGLYRGAFYSQRALKFAIKSRLTGSAKLLSAIKRKPLSKLVEKIPNKSRPLLRNIAIEIHQSNCNFVALTSSNSKLTANDIAKASASYIQSDILNIAIINFSTKQQKFNDNGEKNSKVAFSTLEEVENVSVLQPNGNLKPIDALGNIDFNTKLVSLQSKFNYILLCADNADAIVLARALIGQNVLHIALSRRRKTKVKAFKELHEMLPIQGLIYE
jgi:uncharacterized protein involved in exopolysaccharide biosynthesis